MIPRRILVATDGSPGAKAAETLAAEQAGLMSGSGPVDVVVLTVAHDVGHVSAGTGVIPPSAEADEAKRASQAGAEHIRSLVSGLVSSESVRIEAKVLQSLTLVGGIIAEAHATGTCSLIVMGNRGHGGVTEALLGSVSQGVVHRAHCPVVIVRA